MNYLANDLPMEDLIQRLDGLPDIRVVAGFQGKLDVIFFRWDVVFLSSDLPIEAKCAPPDGSQLMLIQGRVTVLSVFEKMGMRLFCVPVTL